MKKLLSLIVVLMLFSKAYPVDVLTEESSIMIAAMSKSIKQQASIMALQEGMLSTEMAGHITTKKELEKYAALEQEFDNYLQSFNEIISIAAQMYGFYREASDIATNLSRLNKEVNEHPTNTFAVAFSSKRNKIYVEFVSDAADIVNDLRLVIFDKKMTAAERVRFLMGIRPKLHALNKKTEQLVKFIRYTTMTDVWYEVTDRVRPVADNGDIARRSLERWSNNQSVKIYVRPKKH